MCVSPPHSHFCHVEREGEIVRGSDELIRCLGFVLSPISCTRSEVTAKKQY